MRLSLASYLYVCGVASALLREGNPVVLRVDVEVPAFAVAGGQATLGCSFRLTGTSVYSLKWYHNGTEFYRFVPTERAQAIRTQPSVGFSVTELFRGDQLVTLSLSRLTPSASGRYLCEVMAEHPSFSKEAALGKMTVLQPLSPPVTAGSRQFYHRSEEIKIKCHPRHASPPGHTPVLHWLIDGRLATPDLLRSLPARRPQYAPGIALHLPALQVAAAGGSVRAECRISMGPHARPHSTFITLTVADSHHLQPSEALSLAGRVDSASFGRATSHTLQACTYAHPRPIRILPWFPRLRPSHLPDAFYYLVRGRGVGSKGQSRHYQRADRLPAAVAGSAGGRLWRASSPAGDGDGDGSEERGGRSSFGSRGRR